MSNNMLSIDDLFDTNDLFESAAHFEASLAELDKPKTEKIRIRAYSDEYYQWIGKDIPMPEKKPTIDAQELIKASSNGKTCTACSGTSSTKTSLARSVLAKATSRLSTRHAAKLTWLVNALVFQWTQSTLTTFTNQSAPRVFPANINRLGKH